MKIHPFRLILCAVVLMNTLVELYGSDKLAEPIKSLPYKAKELLSPLVRDTYEGIYLDQVRFPLGGIGSGCISLNGRGALVDWSLFGNPNCGYRPEFSFLGLWAKAGDNEATFRVLEGDPAVPYGWGNENWSTGPLAISGLPHMSSAVFVGRFPFAMVMLKDRGMPLEATIEGWSPFIPGNDRESSIPVACLNITLKNISGKTVTGTLGYNLKNLANEGNDDGTRTELLRRDGFDLLLMRRETGATNGSLAVVSPCRITTWQKRWEPSTLFPTGGFQHFAETFGINGRYDFVSTVADIEKRRNGEVNTNESWAGGVGSIGWEFNLKPGTSTNIPLVISWCFPERKDVPGVRNYYSTQWPDASAAAEYLMKNRQRLENQTRLFQQTLFDSTLPGLILESISSQLAVLRSPTVFREANGTMHGWEGCWANSGSCEGTVDQVWHYVQSIAYLFPALERGMREFDYSKRIKQDGGMSTRVWPTRVVDGETAFDGHFGTILRTCREWQISGDTNWLKKLWPGTKKAVEFPWQHWDANRDGLLDSNSSWRCTLDQHLRGYESFGNSMYMAAMLAGEKMARAMGDTALADECHRIFESGSRKTDELCWNGEYYRQVYDGKDTRNTWLNGVISEQLIGQWWSDMLGLGDIYPRDHIQTAIASVFKYNFVPDCRKVLNTGYTLAMNDDAGLVICSWPKGGRPAQALFYADTIEVGYEDQVAGNLVNHGHILEGLAVMKAIRDRFDGRKRDPYDQIQCGGYYVRSMANYSLLLALSGYRLDATIGRLEFAPRLKSENFKSFFSTSEGWGSFSQRSGIRVQTVELAIKWGQVRLKEIALVPTSLKKPTRVTVRMGGRELASTTEWKDGRVIVRCSDEVIIPAGWKLEIEFRK